MVYIFNLSMFVLMLYVPDNNLSVMSGRCPVLLVQPTSTGTKQRLNCLAQVHNTVRASSAS